MVSVAGLFETTLSGVTNLWMLLSSLGESASYETTLLCMPTHKKLKVIDITKIQFYIWVCELKVTQSELIGILGVSGDH